MLGNRIGNLFGGCALGDQFLNLVNGILYASEIRQTKPDQTLVQREIQPDGTYLIPIGNQNRRHKVKVANGAIEIGDRA